MRKAVLIAAMFLMAVVPFACKKSETPASPAPASAPAMVWKILFASNRGGNYEVYVMNSDGGVQTNLSNNAATESYPSWSPDGTRIAFYSNRDGDNEIYTMNADGSGVSQLTANAAIDYFPSWSPDGTKIAFASDRAG
jgi:Tol biopolymer transport system component